MSIAGNIQFIKQQLPEHVQLVCVSKYHPVEALQEAYDAGQRIFGESKVQEMCEKQEVLPEDIQWHFIGHLQTNKIKYLVPFVSLIHGVDSEKLLLEIEKQAAKNQKTVNCLLQIHIAEEETKFGFSAEELSDLFEDGVLDKLQYVNICGLMGMATNTDDEAQIRKEFTSLKGLFDNLKQEYFKDNSDFKELSIGMSGDYPIAIEEGATLVRIGSAIFGPRLY